MPLTRKTRAWAPFAALLFLVWPSLAWALDFMRPPQASPDEPWKVNADILEHDPNTGVTTAWGNVSVFREGQSVTADKMVFSRGENVVTAEGNVVVHAGEDELAGDFVRMDMSKETGTVTQGSLFLKQSHFYIRGQTIEKTGPDTYTARAATVSSCDGDRPDWKVTSARVGVTIDGYGTASNVVLWARGVPVFYSPYLVFPAKVTRQSGLLSPEFGQSSRKGMIYGQPFYWAASEEQDATFYANIMQKRGVQGGLEWRRVSGPGGKSTLIGTYLDDRQTDGGGAAGAEWGYAGDAWSRPNSSRYWVAGKLDKEWESGLKLKADLDWVSDQDYLDEFRTGDIGFDALDASFARDFGRDLGDYNDPVRTSRISLDKPWETCAAFGGMVWNQDPAARWQDADSTLQTLPFAGFSRSWQRLFSSSVFWELDTNYSHFYREELAAGNRVDVYPRVYMPIPVAGVCQVEPSAGVRQTFWTVDSWNDDPLRQDARSFSRTMSDLGLDVFTEFTRVYDGALGGGQKLRHSLMPKVSYVFVPETGQEDLPDFDAEDRVAGQNKITYALDSSLMAGTAPDQGGLWNFRRVCWLELAQDYDIHAAGEDGSRPFSPVRARLEVAPSAMLSLIAETDWSTYDGSFTYGSATMALSLPQGHQLNVEYMDSEGFSEYVRVSGRFRAADAWTVYGNYERDLQADRQVESGLGIIYEAGCWTLDAGYTDEDGDRQYTFRVTLNGLGSVGGSAAP